MNRAERDSLPQAARRAAPEGAGKRVRCRRQGRTQPGLPLKKGRAQTYTHDYVRHGTTTLFAALNVADGQVIATCAPKHRHQEWLKFLKLIDAQTPPQCTLHLILDNYATHKHPKVRAWLEKHPRFHLHFTPTSASWLNMVERFFREITTKRLRRGVFRSLDELLAASKTTSPTTTNVPPLSSGPPKRATSSRKSSAPGPPSIRYSISRALH